MKILDYRMCDIDGCSSTENLTHYEGDVDLCEWHTYLAPKMELKKAQDEREKNRYTKEEKQNGLDNYEIGRR